MNPFDYRKPHWTLLLAMVIGLVACELAWCHHRRKLQCVPGIPCLPYKTCQFSVVQQCSSATAVLLREEELAREVQQPVLPKPERTQLKFYLADRKELKSDQCSVSRLGVVLEEDGTWRVSLQARQNAPRPEEIETNLASQNGQVKKYTAHIKRNQFVIKVRGVGPGTEDLEQGQPILFEVDVPPFWVDRGEPKDVYLTGKCDRIKQVFDVTRRVEVDFTYR
jgi:hypothetical protein